MTAIEGQAKARKRTQDTTNKSARNWIIAFLPTTDEVEDSVPRERSQGPEPEDDGSVDADSVPSTIEYPEILRLI